MKAKPLLILFILVALVDLFFVATPACNEFRLFSKPFLMPVLAIYLVGSGLTSVRKKILLAGLAFATAGEVVVTHGGISIDEVIVPFIQISKESK